MRGLGSSGKRTAVRNVLLLNVMDIVCLQESKLEIPFASVLKEIRGSKLSDWECLSLSVVGSACGILVGWNEDLFALSSSSIGKFSVTVILKNRRDGLTWMLSSVYGPSDDLIKL